MVDTVNEIFNLIPDNWKEYFVDDLETEKFRDLCEFVTNEYKTKIIYPPKENIFNALKFVSPEDIKVVILGQDPYHEKGQAQGLSFSVNDNVPLPKSLINIFTELHNDIGCNIPKSGNLTKWAEQGVLLLNTVLTVREHDANSHMGHGWEYITNKIVSIVLDKPQPKVFILWGKQAEDMFKQSYKYQKNVFCLKSAHPSPLSAYRGFFGSKPFSKTNDYLLKHYEKGIDWSLS